MTISTIIPFYNLERYVRVTLDSVAAAVAPVSGAVSVEIIAVDDGSTDGTGKVLDAYAREWDCLSVIHQPNGGEGSARNAGLRAATGEWVTFLDGDDCWLPHLLTTFVGTAGRHPEVDVIGFRFQPFDDGQPLPAHGNGSAAGEIAEAVYELGEAIPSAAVLDLGVFPTFFRRERFLAVSFSALPLGADRLYVAECLARAQRIVMSTAVVHGYRVRPDSMARATWNARKIMSMIDFASGSLAAFSASGKRVGRAGAAYLADVLFRVAPKQIRRMAGDRTEVRRHWLAALSRVDDRYLSWHRRLSRAFFRKVGGLWA